MFRFRSFPRSVRPAKPTRRRPALAIDGLENRTVLSASRTLGGLEFFTPGEFVLSGSQVRADGPVQVGVDLPGDTFVPLLQFADGVSFVDGDSTGHFTGHGELTGIVGGQSIDLAGSADRDLSAGSLLTGGHGLGGGKSVSVAGAQFNLTGIDLDGDAVKLQGNISLPQLAGLNVAVQGDDYVIIDAGGVHLTGLDASISDVSFQRAGFGFNLNDAHIHYSSTNNSFGLSGDGSILIAGREVGISLDGDGIVIQNGQLTSINATVTAPEISIGTATLESAGLGLAYSRDADTFSLHGSASLNAGGMHLGVELGDVELEHGHLTHFDAAVNGQFALMGLTVDVENLGMTYDAADDRFAVFGGAFVSSAGGVLDHVGATLGTDAENPGLVIWQGQVQDVDIGIDGTVKVGGMALETKDLTLRYDVPSRQLQLVGGLGVSLAGVFKAEANLTGDGLTIDANSGAIHVHGLQFKADADFGAVHVHDLMVEYQENDEGTSWAAAGTVQLAGGIEVGGTFEIVNGKLSRIAISYDKGGTLGLPILDTGLYLTHLAGDITNLNDPTNVQVALNAQVTFGRSVKFLGKEYALFQADGTLTVNKDDLNLKGNIQLAAGLLGTGTATVDLNWATKAYTVGYAVDMYAGVFHQEGLLQLNGLTAVKVDALARLQAPTAIRDELKRFGFPTTFATADFHLRIDRDRPASENYAEASVNVAGLTATVRYDFDKNLTLDISSGALKKLSKALDAAGHAITKSFDKVGNVAQTVTETLGTTGVVVYRETVEAGKKVIEAFNNRAEILTRQTITAAKTVTDTFTNGGTQLCKTVTETGGKVVTDTYAYLRGAVRHVSKLTQQGADKMTELYDDANKVVTRIYDEAGYLTTDTIDAVGNTVKRVTKYLSTVTTEVWDALGHSLERIQGDGVKFVSRRLYATGQEVQTWYRNGNRYLKVTLQGGYETMRETWDEGYDLGKAGAKYFKGEVTAAGTLIQTTTTRGAGWTRNTFESTGRQIREIADNANHYKKEVKEAGSKTWRTVTNTFEDAGNTIGNGFTSVGHTLGGLFS